ncbi:hypothetical protein GKC29_06195 [Micromonospora sp. WMMC415]|uniref:hypothetical protein n=1 Tax=Micromonospora sp. WMMC415 TaxID=2675222 RepID=UPI0012B44754|nr:hypothetical protein [Micromonospora sp. WMMC415]QGN50642.1 hypothetical protein GKC29_06195 [Micromonospora sp. WMMC415]
MQPPAGSQVSRVPAQRPPSDQLAPPPLAPAPIPPRRRVRTILTVTAAVFVALLLGGLAAGYVLYDRATAPDRSAPDVVVSGYLHAFLVDRNDARAAAFTCRDGASVAELQALRGDLVSREERFSTDISVSWGSLLVRSEGDQAVVEVELVISAYVDGIAQTDRQPWQFNTRLTDDWRVCGGRRAT